MVTEILKRMTGEELLLLNVVSDGEYQAGIDAELDHRSLHGTAKSAKVRGYMRTADRKAALTAVA